ncbi:MAG: thioredoxin domain-containing protein [Sedimentisphaerales bacterium]|nr:thioredoxin domain-containing protein [Sedimentisphaerales bacterium]
MDTNIRHEETVANVLAKMEMCLMIKIKQVLLLVILCVSVISSAQDQEDIKKVSSPAIWLESRTIDLGPIPVEQEIITGKILFMNEGNEPLEILKVSGPCACFLGSSGDKILLPGHGGEIEVKFDKRQIESGPVKRLVVLETNDPKNEKVRLYVTFTIERTQGEELRLLRDEVTDLKREMQALRADMKKVLAALNDNNNTRRTVSQPSKPQPDTKIYTVEIGPSPLLGQPDAPVTITAFIDFECPFCVREFPKFKKILDAYPEQVRLVFKHRPLSFHKKAPAAHAAAQLALEQGGTELFWKMHDKIVENPKALDISDLRNYAQSLEMDLKRFDDVMNDSKKIDELLALDLKTASQCNVRATPTIMINGLKLADRSLEGYKSRIDSLLAEKTAQK